MSRGLIMRTAGWAGSSFIVRPGAHAQEVYDLDTELGTDVSDPKAFADSITAWANDAARGWSGSVTFSYSWFAVADDPRHGLRLTATESTAWRPSTALQAKLAMPSSTVDSSCVSTAGCPHTVWPGVHLALRDWMRFNPDEGPRSGAGSWTMACQPQTHFRPSVLGLVTRVEAHALAEAMRGASNPRTGLVWDTGANTWRAVSIGAYDRPRARNLTHFDTSLEVLA